MITLRFPPTGGGEDDGLNDPGIETFEGRFGGHMARECAQNVADASATADAPVRLEFHLIDLSVDEIPCADALKDTFRACHEFWADEPKTKRFFKHAESVIGKRSISVLKISDYGTTGLTGFDHEKTGKWYCLVRSGGVTNKTSGTGGSFGIGKFAPFAASHLRTVFYSTRTISGEVAFQGVCRLVSHTQDGETTQGTGYIGNWDGAAKLFTAVRNPTLIPEPFQRPNPGTDIYVLAYRDDGDWENNLLRTILSDFWPAIIKGRIEFRVSSTVVNRDTLPSLMSDFATKGDFEGHRFFKAFTDPSRKKFETTIDGLGKVELYLVVGDDLPKHVALTRKTGMVISTKRFNSRQPFCGYFVCENEEGNETLRSLEPPRHDTWEDRDRGTREGRAALQRVFQWVRECIRSLNPATTEASLDLPDLARWLPDDADDGQDLSPTKNPSGPEDRSMESTTPANPLVVSEHIVEPQISFVQAPNSGDAGTGGREGEFKPHDGGGSSSRRRDGTIETGRGPRRSRREKTPGPQFGLRSAVIGDVYRLVVRSDSEYEGPVRVQAIGDDGREIPVSIEKVTHAGKNIRVTSEAVIDSIKFAVGSPEILEVTLTTPGRLALNVVAP